MGVAPRTRPARGTVFSGPRGFHPDYPAVAPSPTPTAPEFAGIRSAPGLFGVREIETEIRKFLAMSSLDNLWETGTFLKSRVQLHVGFAEAVSRPAVSADTQRDVLRSLRATLALNFAAGTVDTIFGARTLRPSNCLQSMSLGCSWHSDSWLFVKAIR